HTERASFPKKERRSNPYTLIKHALSLILRQQ
ncbi:MAG: hypothetical protein ACI8RD_010532, partial [Bacillariaceae sp.]